MMEARVDIRLTQADRVALMLFAERWLAPEDKSRMGKRDRSEVGAFVRAIARGKLTPIMLPVDERKRRNLELILRLFVDETASLQDTAQVGKLITGLLELLAQGDLKILPKGA